jgi:hypothetical protein
MIQVSKDLSMTINDFHEKLIILLKNIWHHRIRLIRNYMSFNDSNNIRFNNILLESSVYQLI